MIKEIQVQTLSLHTGFLQYFALHWKLACPQSWQSPKIELNTISKFLLSVLSSKVLKRLLKSSLLLYAQGQNVQNIFNFILVK